MQKLEDTTFYCYPKNQDLCLLYKDANALNTRLFKALSIQISPKEGFFLKLRKSRLGHYLGLFQKNNSLKIAVSKKGNYKVGYKSNGKILLFDFDKDVPKSVCKLSNNVDVSVSAFLGYSVIEAYTKTEYLNKRIFIKLALKQRWKALLNGAKLHGDFTHFNVLTIAENKVIFIDHKPITNALLFDHFYFYAYYTSCLDKCKTISKEDILFIKNDLRVLINEICLENNIKSKFTGFNLKDAVGIHKRKRESLLKEFESIFTA